MHDLASRLTREAQRGLTSGGPVRTDGRNGTTPAAPEGRAGVESRRLRQPMNSLSSLSSAAFGLAPTICFTSSPFWKTLSVGMPVTR